MTPIDIFVIDTSTLLSALILPNFVPARAFQKADDTGRLAFSTATLDEFQDVIIQPKFDRYVLLPNRLEFLEKLTPAGLHVPITHTITACRDSKDNKFLGLALSASASFIISGDIDLLILHPFQGVTILSPADYLLN